MIPILMYHQLDFPDPRGTRFRSLKVHPKRFARQMIWLKRLGYQGLSMRDLMPYLQGKKKGKVVGLTFDDGYQNVLQYALPVLNQVGFTSTNYMVSQHFSHCNFWDTENGVPTSALMSIEEARQWLNGGQEIGSHTCDHVHLNQIAKKEAKRQITQSKADLEALFQTEITAFCYPYGCKNSEVMQWVKEAGYTTATTTERGLALASDNLFALPRVTIARTTHLPRFLQKCLTKTEHKKRLRHRP